jgi:hypothetical protein
VRRKSQSAGRSAERCTRTGRRRHAGPGPLVLMIVWTLCGLGLQGCGYTLAGHGSFLPAYIKTIGIPVFTNHTTVFNAETLLTDRVRREFIGRGKYTVLPTPDGVDATLTGDITSISVTPASFSTTQLASRYTIAMSVNMQLHDNHSKTLLWENPSLIFRQDYDATSGTGPTDPNAFFGQEANALERVSTDFARTIVSAILEAF